MARLKSMGQVRRRLLRVTGVGAMPVAPAAVYHGDRKIGEVRSTVATPSGWAGLALLNLMNLSATTGLSLVPGGPAELTLAETP
jgi:folate-binding Fe-S cluster repair protein YgfZ